MDKVRIGAEDVNEILATAAIVSIASMALFSNKTVVWFGVFTLSMGALLYRTN